jgi:aerobic-type carbon monoxide dehydrogenase small subunit (CoxS/CutS family)
MHRCAECRLAHNAREAARRKARRTAALCTVCGAKAVTVDGEPLSTCKAHREYYRTRAAG